MTADASTRETCSATAWDRRDWAAVCLILAGAAVLFFWGLGAHALWDNWEPKYPQTVREMMERGDPMTPYFRGRLRFSKPILFYWTMYPAVWIGGNNEFTARFPSALSATLGLLALYGFVRRLRGRRPALLAAGILGTTPQYYFMARQSMPDMLFTFFLLAAMGSFALGRFDPGPRRRRYFVLFYAATALAFLTKGPLGCAFVGAALLLFWALDFDPARLVAPRALASDVLAALRYYHVGTGILVFVAIAAPWYAWMLIDFGERYYDWFFGSDNIKRFSKSIRSHYGIVNFYVATFFQGMYPWAGMLAGYGAFLFYGRREIDDESRQRWYFLSWLVACFLLLTLAATKLQHYLLPATPALAVLVALLWDTYLREPPPRWVRPVFLASVVFVLLAFRDFTTQRTALVFDNFAVKHDLVLDIEPALRWFLVAWTLVMFASLFVRRRSVVAALAVLVALANGVYYCQWVVPSEDARRSMRDYAVYVSDRLPQGTELYYLGEARSSLYYYHDWRRLRQFDEDGLDDLVRLVANRRGVYIIADREHCSDLMVALRKKSRWPWRVASAEHRKSWLITSAPPEAETR